MFTNNLLDNAGLYPFRSVVFGNVLAGVAVLNSEKFTVLTDGRSILAAWPYLTLNGEYWCSA